MLIKSMFLNYSSISKSDITYFTC